MFYKHYKGGLYELITVGKLENSSEEHAVYKSVTDGQIWIRPISEFKEKFVQIPNKHYTND